MVDELTVECSQRSSGCTHTCQRQHLEAHLEHSCLYVQVTCSEEGCDRTILRKDLGKHTHDCAHRVVTCEGCGVLVKASDLDVSVLQPSLVAFHTQRETQVHNSECTAQDASCSYCEEAISRSRLKEHHEMCQEYPVPCQYAPYGCSWVGPRRNIKMEHLAGCAYAAINGFFSIYEEQTVRLRDENTLLRQQLERSEIAIQSLRREIKIAQHALGPWWRANASNGESSGSSQERSGGSDSRRGIDGITVTTTTSSTSTPRSNVGNASTPTTAYTFDPSSRRGASLSAIMASFPDSPIMGTDSDDLEFEREHYSPMAVYNDSIHHGPHHLRDAMMTTNSMPHHSARAFPPILRFPDTVHTSRSLATHSNLHSSSTAVAPVDLSSTLEGALSSLRRSIVTLSASLDSLGRRQDIALTTENLRMNEEVGALRAVVHGLRMQVGVHVI